jgi:hypothetical protein
VKGFAVVKVVETCAKCSRRTGYLAPTYSKIRA